MTDTFLKHKSRKRICVTSSIETAITQSQKYCTFLPLSGIICLPILVVNRGIYFPLLLPIFFSVSVYQCLVYLTYRNSLSPYKLLRRIWGKSLAYIPVLIFVLRAGACTGCILPTMSSLFSRQSVWEIYTSLTAGKILATAGKSGCFFSERGSRPTSFLALLRWSDSKIAVEFWEILQAPDSRWKSQLSDWPLVIWPNDAHLFFWTL